MSVSLIASSVRPQLYESFFDSLKDCSVDYEVVFAGNIGQNEREYKPILPNSEKEMLKFMKHPELKYYCTENIKPAQCYEIARRKATKEVIVWVADDCEFKGDILGKAYNYWKAQNNKKLMLSLQTREFYLDSGDGFCDMTKHAFHGGNPKTPLMAPIAMISREYLEELGGFDRRYLCGQYENQVVMQAYADGAVVEVFGDKTSYVEIDHIKKSIRCGESKKTEDFFNRPFAKGYIHDRKILESVCAYEGNRIKIRSFEPYEDKDLFTKSQSYKGHWE